MSDPGDDVEELLFFDTFSHEVHEDLNLDLVQFPKPVYITQVRIIPLGARVEADFPGGVRLGATNPSTFNIEFFVNDLGKPGASTFECLGAFDYNQNDCIHLGCVPADETIRQIPTDGLVLRGCYTTITLAVYGKLTKGITEPIVVVVPAPVVVEVPVVALAAADAAAAAITAGPVADDGFGAQSAASFEVNAVPEIIGPAIVGPATAAAFYDEAADIGTRSGSMSRRYSERRSTTDDEDDDVGGGGGGGSHADWDRGNRGERGDRSERGNADRDRDRDDDHPHKKMIEYGRRSSNTAAAALAESSAAASSGGSRSRTMSHRAASRSSSRERDYHSRSQLSSSKRDWSHSPDYHRQHSSSSSSRRTRTISYEPRGSSSSKRDRSRDDKRTPRTPPTSPRRLPPRTPERLSSSDAKSQGGTKRGAPIDHALLESGSRMRSPALLPPPISSAKASSVKSPTPEPESDVCMRSPLPEPFEPILSDDEDIADDDEEVAAAVAADATSSGDAPAADAATPSTTPVVKSPPPVEIPPRSPTPEPVFDDSDIDYATLPPVLHTFDPLRDTHVMSAYAAANINAVPDPMAHKEFTFAHKILNKISEQPCCCEPDAFPQLPADAQELWVHSTEHLLQALQLLHTNFAFAQRRTLLETLVAEHSGTLGSLLRCGLDWDSAMAQPQPTYKLRHLKIGARLTELLGGCNDLVGALLFRDQFDLFGRLFALYGQQYMALSIRLLLLRAIGSLLDSRIAMEYFLRDGATPVYQLVVRSLQAQPPTRAKFALRALLQKVNLFEALQLLREICTKIYVAGNRENAGTDHQLLTATLEQIEQALGGAALGYQQPRRFLPVSAKFEITPDPWAQRAAAATLHAYFEAHAFGETLLLLVANRGSLPQNVLALSVRLVERLTRTAMGLDYLAGCGQLVTVLVRCLAGDAKPAAGSDDAMDTAEADSADETTATEKPSGRFYDLGIEIAYRMLTKQLLDALVATPPENGDELIEILHTLYSLTAQPSARAHCVATIAMSSNCTILLDTVERERKLLGSLKTPGVLNSPIIGYAIDLLDQTVRHSADVQFLASHGAAIVDLVKSALLAAHAQPAAGADDATVATLQELAVWLKPLDLADAFGFDNIVPLCEVLKQSAEFIVTFPGDLITAVRMLHHLAIAPDDSNGELTELRYKFVALQLYSADGIALLCSMLDKLSAHFEQPHLHRAPLATAPGVLVAHIVLPAVQCVRHMLCYVIRARDAHFRDLTAIEPLLRAFALAHAVPEHGQAAREARAICAAVVHALLAYTQPSGGGGACGVDDGKATGAAAVTVPDSHETVHKSLWTQMCGELLRFTAAAPCNLVAGLEVLSALLPVPLPVLTLQPLSDAECARLVTERQLWSAHLHPKSPELSAVLQTAAASPHPPLRRVFARVCQQLADLAPNMSLLVSKAVVELFLAEANGGTTVQLQVLRLLISLAQRARCKVSLLSMLPGKLSEALVTIVKIGTNETAQRLVFELVQVLMCPDVRLDGGLANALPSKEMVALFVVASVEYFLASRSVVALRAMQMMAGIDFPLFLLRSILDTRKEQLLTVIASLLNGATDATIDPLCDFLLDFHEVQSEHRTIRLTANDLAAVLMWGKPLPAAALAALNAGCPQPATSANAASDMDMSTPTTGKANIGASDIVDPNQAAGNNAGPPTPPVHPIRQLLSDASDGTNPTGLSAKVQSKLAQLLALLEQSNLSEKTAELAEPAMPAADGIVQQFAARAIFRVVAEGQAHTADAQSFWPADTEADDVTEDVTAAAVLSADVANERPPQQLQQQQLLPTQQQQTATAAVPQASGPHVACDMLDVMKACLTGLSGEPNLASDCKRLLHLSASPQSQRERTQVAPCFRTRRVEVEPTTGRPDKKIYVSRGRGFTRSQPSRADLFRSRPPNTSRPPSLHVDDFLALETCGAQPTGPTGYNKLSRDIIGIRSARTGRGRGGVSGSGGGLVGVGNGGNGGGGGSDRGRMATPNSVYRNSNRRTNSPSTWISNQSAGGLGNNNNGGGNMGGLIDSMGMQQQQQQQQQHHFRTATAEPVVSSHFGSGGGGGGGDSGGHFGGNGNGGRGGGGRMRGGSGRMQRPFQR